MPDDKTFYPVRREICPFCGTNRPALDGFTFHHIGRLRKAFPELSWEELSDRLDLRAEFLSLDAPTPPKGDEGATPKRTYPVQPGRCLLCERNIPTFDNFNPEQVRRIKKAFPEFTWEELSKRLDFHRDTPLLKAALYSDDENAIARMLLEDPLVSDSGKQLIARLLKGEQPK